MNNRPQTLGVVEKIGYSLGDLSANLIFQTLVTFLACSRDLDRMIKFYGQPAKLSAWPAA